MSPDAPPSPPASDRACTAAELAEALGISKQRVYYLTGLDGFPEPVGWRRGRIWSLEQVTEWRRLRDERRAERSPA